ncbi:MAG: hypothetical protein QOG00_1329 [Pyrinomonadaceae bacterium]|nr:hypothetical protein [Pyrinomonadaceae bacterium]
MAKANQNKSISSPKPIGDSEGFVPANPGESAPPQNPAPPRSDAPTRQEPFQQLPQNLKPRESAFDALDRNERLTNPDYPRKKGGMGKSDAGT